MTEQDQLRAAWRAYSKDCDRARATWETGGYITNGPAFPTFPNVLRDLACGAKTRAGTPCKRRDLYPSGRCKFHGGLSTGPRKRLTP
jgi:hypothetical protein